MIKPINPSPLNTSKELEYFCGECNRGGKINLTNSLINLDGEGNPIETLEIFNCPICGQEL